MPDKQQNWWEVYPQVETGKKASWRDAPIVEEGNFFDQFDEPDGMTLEQKRAVALARARLRLKEKSGKARWQDDPVVKPAANYFDQFDQPQGKQKWQDDPVIAVPKSEGDDGWWKDMPLVQETAAKDAPWYEDIAGYVNKGAQSVASGITGGFADEIAAGLDAPFVAGYRSLVEGQPFDMGKAYDDRVAAYRGDLDSFRSEYPVSALTSEVGGAVVSPVAKLKPIQAMAQGMKTAGTVGKGVRGAGIGATYGGIYGAGNAEGGPMERLEGAAQGAGVGALTGALLTPAIDGLLSVGRAGVQRILSQTGGLNAAERKLAGILRDLGEGDIRLGVQRAEEGLEQGGRDTSLADVTGMAGQRVARAAANVPGAGTQKADDFITTRVAGRGDRLRDANNTLAPADDVAGRAEALAAQRRVDSQPIYQRSVNAENLIPDEQFAAIADDPFMQGVFKRVQKDQLTGLGNMPPNSMPVVDAAKKQLDDMISAATRSGENWRASLLTDKRNQLVQMADNAFPDYAAARQAYAAPSRVKDALETGQSFLKMEPSQISKMLSEAPEQEAQAFRMGARAALDKMISTDTQTAISKLADKKEALWAKVRALFPNDDAFRVYKAKIDAEIQKAQTERFVGPRGGSQTTPLKEDIADLSRMPGGAAADMAMNLATRNWLGLATAPIRGAWTYMSSPNPQMAGQLADSLLTTDKTRLASLLSRIDQSPQLGMTPDQRTQLARMLMAPAAAEGGALSGR